MRITVVLLIVLASVTVLQASPYGKRAKDRLGAWKPKALREKEAAERIAQETAAAEAEAKALEEAKKAAAEAEAKALEEAKKAEEVKVDEQPKAEDASGASGQEQPKAPIGEQVLETSVVVADSPLVDTVVTAEATETSTEPVADPANNVQESSSVVQDQSETAAAVPVAEEIPA